ncbi:MAG: hypothetical protein F6J93_19510 [Oscillatoria sp. SIO1A7]|nr:hypothetical protein [Oscillatoria sp. SIO1A7]
MRREQRLSRECCRPYTLNVKNIPPCPMPNAQCPIPNSQFPIPHSHSQLNYDF